MANLGRVDKGGGSKFLKPEEYPSIAPLSPTLQVYNVARFSFMVEDAIDRVRKRMPTSTAKSSQGNPAPFGLPTPNSNFTLADPNSLATLVTVPDAHGPQVV